MIRIQQAAAIGGHLVRLTLTNGEVIERDLTGILTGRMYEAIRSDAALFKSFRVEAGTLVWPGEIDVCPDMVIWGGPPPPESVARAS